MPLVQISLAEGKTEEYRKEIGTIVHQSMVDTINCPPMDRFQIIREIAKENFIFTPEYLGVRYSKDLIIIQITLNEGRTVELKQALYRSIVEGLQKNIGLSPSDVMINLVEVKKENWSFGNGIAQYA
jgi:4-oxalocrotonate tautomerase